MGRHELRPTRPIASNDADAVAMLASIFTEEADSLRASIRSRIGGAMRGRVDADDVLQESYLAAVARLRHRRDADRAQLLGWVRYIVDQTLIDIQRHHLLAARRSALIERSAAEGEPDGLVPAALSVRARGVSPVDGIIRSERIDALMHAIDELGETDRTLIIARCVRGMSNTQVGELLHMTPENAAVRLNRAKRRVRDLMRAAESPAD